MLKISGKNRGCLIVLNIPQLREKINKTCANRPVSCVNGEVRTEFGSLKEPAYRCAAALGRRACPLSLAPLASSPFGSNGDDRRQRRKQGGAVGAAASRMRGPHQGPKQTLGAATRRDVEERRCSVQPLSLTSFDSSPSRGASGEEAKRYGMPKPPLLGEVARRSRDGEVVRRRV